MPCNLLKLIGQYSKVKIFSMVRGRLVLGALVVLKYGLGLLLASAPGLLLYLGAKK